MLQNHARKYNLPIDTLSFTFEVVKTPRHELTHPKDGVFVHGLFMEGARWDMETNGLADPLPGEMYSVRHQMY